MRNLVPQPVSPHPTRPVFLPKPGGNNPFFQPKLTVGPAHDAFEAEADRVADAATGRGGGFVQPRLRADPAVQRKCAHCEQEDNAVQRKGTGDVSAATPAVEATLAQPGQALDAATRQWAENQMGYDFSAVKIHTDDAAARSAASIRARAYTSGHNVVFGAGEFSPTTESGRRLLAHELAHVVQQGGGGGVVQRTPTADELTQFDELARQIRAHDAYRRLPGASRTRVEQILAIGRRRDNASYYAERMLALLNTPDAPAQDPNPGAAADASAGETQSVEEMNREATEASMYEERSRLFNTEGRLAADVEERASADPARRWTRRRGEGGVRFDVDATDPTNVVVRARVYLRTRARTRPRGMSQADFDRLREQDRQDVAMVRELEDGIEKASAALGYTVDVQFVNRPGPGVFTVDVDMSRWTDSGNFVGNARPLAHELHHLLGLDDRYNYIEAHAENANMTMPNRIYWFRQEMNRVYSPSDSIMESSHTGRVLPDDIAGVTGLRAADVQAAQQGILDRIARVRRQAMHRVQLAYLRLNGPHPTLGRMYRQQALDAARALLLPTATMDDLDGMADHLGRMMSVLTGASIQLGPEIAACGQWKGYVLNQRPPLHLCRSWLTDSPEQQIRTLIHESAHAVGIGEPTGETYEAAFDCSVRNRDQLNVADAWGHFIHCVTGQTRDVPTTVTVP